jgi:hypothetical protein
MQQKDHAINNEDPDFLCTTEDEDGAYSEAEGNETAPGSSKKKVTASILQPLLCLILSSLSQ